MRTGEIWVEDQRTFYLVVRFLERGLCLRKIFHLTCFFPVDAREVQMTEIRRILKRESFSQHHLSVRNLVLIQVNFTQREKRIERFRIHFSSRDQRLLSLVPLPEIHVRRPES